jgi:hypothetical protein
MGQMLRQARATGLKTQFMGPEGVVTPPVNIAGDAAEGMLVTMPKRYDQDPANRLSSMRSKRRRKIRAVRMSGSPMPPCSLWQPRWIVRQQRAAGSGERFKSTRGENRDWAAELG